MKIKNKAAISLARGFGANLNERLELYGTIPSYY
jgi:hypothetical protein